MASTVMAYVVMACIGMAHAGIASHAAVVAYIVKANACTADTSMARTGLARMVWHCKPHGRHGLYSYGLMQLWRQWAMCSGVNEAVRYLTNIWP